MAMGRRRARQQQLWIAATELPRARGHVFYDKMNEILRKEEFDVFAEAECLRFYKSEVMGRPSIAPGVYFRMLMVGYFEGIDSERGIAWRCADSLSLKGFLGYELTEMTPDHSTVSRTRRLIDVETHGLVFTWMLKVLGGTWVDCRQDHWCGRHNIGGERRAEINRQTGHRRKLHGFSKASGPGQRHRNADAGGSGKAEPKKIEEGLQ